MTLKIGNYTVNVELGQGPYITTAESGIGKTWLYTLIRSAEEVGCNVAAFTYAGKMHDNAIIIRMLTENKYDFVVLDRYDLYADDNLLTVINSMMCPVFIDYKGSIPVTFGGNWCVLDTTEKGVHLYVDDF